MKIKMLLFMTVRFKLKTEAMLLCTLTPYTAKQRLDKCTPEGTVCFGCYRGWADTIKYPPANLLYLFCVFSSKYVLFLTFIQQF